MAEEFTKDNDYTISAVSETSDEYKSGNASDKVYKATRLTKIFNFLSAQVTTVTHASIFQSRGGESGGSSSVSTQMIIQNFSDIQAFGEIRLMHQKLVELGGKPPALEDILPILDKKSFPLRPE